MQMHNEPIQFGSYALAAGMADDECVDGCGLHEFLVTKGFERDHRHAIRERLCHSVGGRHSGNACPAHTTGIIKRQEEITIVPWQGTDPGIVIIAAEDFAPRKSNTFEGLESLRHITFHLWLRMH